MLNIFQPDLGINELLAAGQVMQSNWIGYGSKVTQFENAFANAIKVSPETVVSTTSCTEGLFQITYIGKSPSFANMSCNSLINRDSSLVSKTIPTFWRHLL